MSRPPSWTDEELRVAGMMYSSGRTYNEIAKALGRTRSSVKAQVERMKKKEPLRWRPFIKGKQSHQPCWTCFFGSGAVDPVTKWKCPWPDGKPVEGWDAEPVPYFIYNTNAAPRVEQSYEINSCPHYRRINNGMDGK